MFKKIQKSPRDKFTKITKKRETILSLYFGWRLRIILEKTTERIRGPFRTHRRYVSAILILVLLISSVLMINGFRYTQAATYTFSQTSWAGGVSGDTLTHPTNSTTNYASASNLVLGENSVALGITTNTFTQTSDTDFAGGTFSSTVQNGTAGSGASVRLSSTFNTTLAFLGTIATGASPNSVAVSPDSASVYVANYSSDTVSQYSRNISTGVLTSLGTIATGAGPYSVAVSPDSASVYVNLSSNTVSQYSRNPSTGILTSLGTIATGMYPASVAVSPDGISVYVGNGLIGSGSTISRYSRNTSTGILTSLGTIATGAGSASVAISPDGTSVYVSNRGSDTVSQYSRNTSTGALTSLGTIATGMYPTSVAVSPDGISVYASSRSTVSEYSRNTSTGSLASFGTIATDEINPSSIAVSPDSASVYVTNSGSSTVSQYSRARTYSSSGTFTSSVINIGSYSSFGTFSWSETLNSQTLTMQARSANNSDMTGADEWGSCSIANGADLSTSSCIHSGDSYIQYQASLSTTDTAQTPILDSVTISTNKYNSTGNVISQPFNTNDSANQIGELSWNQGVNPLVTGTGVIVSLRASDTLGGLSSATWYPFTGLTENCSIEDTTVTCPDLAMPEAFDTNAQYWQYKIEENSTGVNTPTVSSITVKYVVNAPPEVQNVSASQGEDGIVTISYQARDIDSMSGSVTQGEVTPSFEYWDGDSWEECVTISSGATDNLDTSSQDWTSTQAVTWNPTTDFANQFQNNTAQIQVTIDDNEGANNIASLASANFTLDTKSPVISNLTLDASTTPAQIAITSTDDSTYQMKLAQGEDQADCETNLSTTDYETYNATPTLTLTQDPAVICFQLQDQYSNTSTISHIDSPETPTAFMIQDTTNTLTTPNEFRLFAAWKISTDPDFSKYELYRSTDNITFTKIYETYTQSTNSYPDNTVIGDTQYYYKVKTIDSNNNQSFYSETVQAKANGIQDFGEGGGGSSEAPPIISNVESSNVYTSQAEITWETDVFSNSTVGYSTTQGSFTTEIGSDTMYDNEQSGHYGPHTVILTNLTPDTDYYFQVKSTGTNNITATDDNTTHLGYHFKTLPGPKITEGSVTISKTTNTSATINWITDISSSSKVTYSTSADMSDPANFLGTNQDSTNHEVTINNLTQGTRYYFFVQSIYNGDTATDNNQYPLNSYYSFTTTQDLMAPTITFNPDTDISKTTTTAKITFTTSEQATSTLEYGTDTSYGTELTSDNLNINQVFDISNLTPNTNYHFKITAEDENGNINNNSNTDYIFTTNSEEVIDEDGPEISGVNVSDITYNSAKIEWETDEEGNSLVDYGETTNFGNTQGNSLNSSTLHEVVLKGLNAITTYYYQVKSQDSNNNISTDDNSSQGYTFTTLSGATDTDNDGAGDQLQNITAEIQRMIDTYEFTEEEIQAALSGLYQISISSSGPSVTIEGTTATIKWNTNRPSIGKVFYWQDSDNEDTKTGQAEITTIASTNHEITLKNLNAGTKYNFYVISQGLLNAEAISTTEQFTTEDTPTISAISISNVTLNEATISWGVSDSIKESTLQYGTDTKYGNEEQGQSNLNTITLTNLKENTTYHLRIQALDNQDETIQSDDYSFTTNSLPIISNLQATDLQTEQVTIKWNTNTNTDSRVEYKTTGEKEGQTQGQLEAKQEHQVTLYNLTPGTNYTYTVFSKDPFNNESQSEEQQFTTEEDNNPPIIQNIKSETTVFPGKESRIQTIISWITDKDTDSFLAYREGTEKDPDINQKLQNNSFHQDDHWKILQKDTLTNTHLFVITDFKPSTVYQFKIISRDKRDKFSISDTHSLLTPSKQQSVFDLIIKNFEETFGWVKNIH